MRVVTVEPPNNIYGIYPNVENSHTITGVVVLSLIRPCVPISDVHDEPTITVLHPLEHKAPANVVGVRSAEAFVDIEYP